MKSKTAAIHLPIPSLIPALSKVSKRPYLHDFARVSYPKLSYL
jgi:hypothetical protein